MLIIHFGEVVDRVAAIILSLISCTIITGITFRFWNSRYKKNCHNKYVYIILAIAYTIIVGISNFWSYSKAGIIINFMCSGLIVFFFYKEENARSFVRVFESTAFVVVIEAIKTAGIYISDYALGYMLQSNEIVQSIKAVISVLIMLFLYWMIVNMVWKKSTSEVSIQYISYLLIAIWGILNILTAKEIFDSGTPDKSIFIIIYSILGFFYLLIFMKCFDQKKDYEFQLKMMEQQEKLHYENYKVQRKKYEKALSILHDVKKHIMVIENLYHDSRKSEAIIYTKQINDMLVQVVPMYYTKNPIMDCLLSDKIKIAEQLGIVFQLEILTEDIDFMKPVDITTLFGNLFDNAIAASKRCDNRKYIGFYMESYNDMLSIKLENSIPDFVPLRNGKIVNERGIGLTNIQGCVDTYDGSIIYKNRGAILECHILLSKVNTF